VLDRPARSVPNLLKKQFTVDEPDRVWATDITHIRTLEGWLYVAVVLDLGSRRIVGWSMQPTLHRDLAIQALLSAQWNRRPTSHVIIHSDQDPNTVVPNGADSAGTMDSSEV
jgi:putative transposase